MKRAIINICLILSILFIILLIYLCYSNGYGLNIPIGILISIISIISLTIGHINNLYTKYERLLNFTPNLLSTIGVLGTFVGIYIGLKDFDSANITASVPKLLDGLKTAFITSIFGMIGSIVVNLCLKLIKASKMINRPTKEEESTAQICFALESLEKSINSQNNSQVAALQGMCSSLKSIKESSDLNVANLNALANVTENLNESICSKLDVNAEKKDSTNSILKSNNELILGLNKKTNDVKQILTQLQNKSEDNIELLTQLGNIEEENLEVSKGLSQVLRGEVIEITTHMDKTNRLLTKKFDEFSELLQKSNTEALVEVMKEVTSEFQKQMSSLINKLVQENFQELNNSVKQLNDWQQENKEMIVQLTEKYQSMNISFGNTSNVLKEVSEYSSELTSEAGHLSRLIQQLQSVMIDDTKFQDTSKMLTEATEHSKDSIMKFSEVTNDLNQWIKKQKGFKESVSLLMNQLEDIRNMKDYGEEFWKSTKHGLEKNVGIIQSGSMELQKQVEYINKEFYDRLNTTFSGLDNCLTAIVKNDKR